MTSRESMLKGGESFGKQVLIPNNGVESILYSLTTREKEGFEMPPKESEKLSEEETNWVRAWIDAGAPWPNDERSSWILDQYSNGETVKTSGGLSKEWTDRRYESQNLWAYRSLKIASVPKEVHPIDWFIDRKLNSIGLSPAPTADPKTLARRLRFAFTGLPPQPDEVDQFEAAYREKGIKAVGEFSSRLMSSPQYGEHFARHWLDVTRYADSAGFANDYSRPNAWRYRDYVIRSFNQDKSFKDFVREQIAGDEWDSSDPRKLSRPVSCEWVRGANVYERVSINPPNVAR